jgi:hypothetical protein
MSSADSTLPQLVTTRHLTSRLQTSLELVCYLRHILTSAYASLLLLQMIATEPASEKPSLTKVVGTLKRAVEVRLLPGAICRQQHVHCMLLDQATILTAEAAAGSRP